ncbi:DUF5977 domain-containing protein [Pedobacter heparinus]|uniref:DUF5977 domain-containing protein n=1 Tax=Pedobacter heparinus TaxID=984 RepID=UPI00292E2707|nr:DUF5977 domain-containing protein [Pedobacter heparinus]
MKKTINYQLYFFLIGLISYPTISKSQFETKSGYHPSSNSSYAKVALDNSVDLYTGALNVSIPLTEIDLGKTEHKISIFYDGKGQKVEDYSSSIGLGWNLSGGGYVSRTVRGLPDEHANGYCGTNHIGDNVTYYDYNTLNKGYIGDWDIEPDLFYVNLPSGSFYFVLSTNGTPLILNNNDFKIVSNPFGNNSQNYDKINGAWIIQDINGFEYKLGTSTGTEIIQTKFSHQSTSQEYTSTWNLIEVTTPNTNEKLKFEYENIGQINQLYYNSVRSQVTNVITTVCSFNVNPTESFENNVITILNKLILKRIYNDLEQVKFVYSSRLDIINEKKLDFIELYDSSDLLVNKIRLHNDYFFSSSGERKLKLSGVDQISSGAKALKLARFYYDESYSSPNRNSNSFDHWGYYNNNSAGTPFYPVADKVPNLARTRINNLISIENEYGGLTKFEYGLNEYFDGTNNINRGGLHVSKIVHEDQGILSSSESYIYRDTLTNQSYGRVQTGQIDYQTVIYYTLGYGTIAGFPAPCIAEVRRTTSKSYNNNLDIFNSHVGYSKVIKKSLDGSKIEYQFTNYDLYTDSTSTFTHSNQNQSAAYNYTTLLPNISQMSLRGKILSEKYYNSNNLKVKESNYEYTRIKEAEVKGLKSLTNNININQNTKNFIVSAYSFLKQYLLLKKKRETDITTNGNIETESNFFYESSAHVQPTRITTVGSDGIVTEKQLSYPSEMVQNLNDPTGIYQSMFNKNLLSPVIEEKELIGGELTKVTKTNFYQPYSNIYKPLSLENYNSVSQLNETKVQYHGYDLNGNILSSSNFAGIKTNYLWGYKGHYPIAEVKNAELSAVIAALGGQTNVDAFREIANPSPSAVNAFLLPLRTNLPDAQINTYIYLPMLGLYSETDAKGMTTYYEYDMFNRLQNIKDNNQNILKNYTYNYLVPSTPIYYNIAVSQSVTKNNCPPGQTGSSVDVTVPADKYMSTISQEDANRKAYDEILADGQNYANSNGTCIPTFTLSYGPLPYGKVFEIGFLSSVTGTWVTYQVSDSGVIYDIPQGTYTVTIDDVTYSGVYDFYFIGAVQSGQFAQFGPSLFNGPVHLDIIEK